MNVAPRHAQLLDRRHVAMVSRARQDVHLAAQEPCVLRTDPAFRAFGAPWVSQVSFNRVQATQRKAVDLGRLRHRVQWSLHRNALQGRCGTSMGDEGTGARRYLLSKNKR